MKHSNNLPNTVEVLLAAFIRLLDESPFISDCISCECGENGNGIDEDGGICEHIQARRAIAVATGQDW